jgi:DNA-binding beta-propeller fold protein YncE
VAVGHHGQVYVTDSGNSPILELASDGSVRLSTIGPKESASSVSGVAVDPLGNVYVVDTGDGRVRKFVP